jgi:DNA segregation ATPase FtsK/SpoIIIE-like protein
VIAAAAALDPSAKLWLLDGKTEGAEFVHWAPAAHRLVRGRQVEEAVEVFAELEQRVEARYREIVARGEVFVCEDMELDVLMIDELPQFMRIFETDTKAQQAAVKTIRGAIWKLIAVGRAAGMITVVSAQKPTADIIPSESRDLIDHKFALHCNTKPMSDAILGAGAGEEAPANAADIPSGQPGVGYYVGDAGVQKMRSFFISHHQAMEIASRAAGRQMDAELEAMA